METLMATSTVNSTPKQIENVKEKPSGFEHLLKSHPTYVVMIGAAVISISIEGDYRGSSREYIKKYIASNYGVNCVKNSAFNRAMKKLLDANDHEPRLIPNETFRGHYIASIELENLVNSGKIDRPAEKKNIESKVKLSAVPEFSKVGKKWTPEEDKQLKEEVNCGLLNSEIAKLHCRTEKGIEFRRLHLTRELYVIDGMTPEEASKEMKIDVVDLQLYLAQLEERELAKSVKNQQKMPTSLGYSNDQKYFPTPYELIVEKSKFNLRDEGAPRSTNECKCPMYTKCNCC